MKNVSIMILLIFITGGITLNAENRQSADLILQNGKIKTMCAEAEGTALAIKDGKIIAVGTDKEISSYAGRDTKMVNLEGKFVMPGFIESHAHFYSLGQSLLQLNLVGTSSAEQIAEMVGNEAAKLPDGQWIMGRGWDQNDWPVKKFPDAAVLDKASPENPVYLRRIDGHAVWVNSAALKLAGITSETEDPEGGEIIRGINGEPTGILVDNAIGLVSRLLKNPDKSEIERALLKSQEHCFELGITSFHDMGISGEMINLLKELYSKDELKIRLFEYISLEDDDWQDVAGDGPQVGLYNGRLTVGGIKAFADGALGSRGALMFENYSDRETKGLLVTSEDRLAEIAKFAKEKGYQMAVHAIGDRANHVVLNAYERNLGKNPDNDRRWRIEHAQILHKDDIPRFKELGVVPSMQPTHCTSDMPWAPARVGDERIKGAYIWKTLIKSGVKIPGGSDAPVEHVNPLFGIYSAVTRQDQQGNPEKGWNPSEKVTMEEALKMFTTWGAWAGFEEELKGRIKPGYYADIIVLDKDLTDIQPLEIPEAKVLMTILAGDIVYQKKN